MHVQLSRDATCLAFGLDLKKPPIHNIIMILFGQMSNLNSGPLLTIPFLMFVH